MHERQLHDLAIFVTLTYDDAHLPENGSLDKTHFQEFMQSLRNLHQGPAKKHNRDNPDSKIPVPKIRYFHCGEYGESTRRPHYHAILYGIDFSDKKRHTVTPTGETLYSSEILSNLWGKGHCLIGNVTFESAAYVARYCMKKINGEKANAHYTVTNLATGEIIQLVPEYATMSRRPGIGSGWYAKYSSDVFPSDTVICKGREASPPRFYKKLLEREDPKLERKIHFKRIRKAAKHKVDQTPERLRTRLEVKQAQLNQLKRTL